MRNAGVLLHLSSLPSEQGIGTFGQEAYNFIDFLKQAGQTYWQMLPVGPTGFGDSPYQSFSAFAGNPYFIDCATLVTQGLLTTEELRPLEQLPHERVDFGGLYEKLTPILEKAYGRFSPDDDYRGFVAANEYWLWDYCLYMALREHFECQCWNTWPAEIRTRQPQAMDHYHQLLEEKIKYHLFIQYKFYTQLIKLRAYADDHGILLMGDMPIYVALDSADSWAHQNYLQLDEDGMPINVAGCPPDGFSPTGQLWGNPLYNWAALEQDGFDWWIKRVAHQAAFFAKVRIDHFRGFEAYFAIPAADDTAVNGHWEKGPGMALFSAMEAHVGRDVLVAEDLGFLTKEVEILLEETGFPGMSVLQFAFHEGSVSKYLPHNLTRHNIIYTGTHDNDTTVGWLEKMSEVDRGYLFEYLGIYNKYEAGDRLIRTAHTSVCETAIIPVQDMLYLGSEARMNTPGTAQGNWAWRVKKEQLTPILAADYYRRTQLGGRLPQAN